MPRCPGERVRPVARAPARQVLVRRPRLTAEEQCVAVLHGRGVGLGAIPGPEVQVKNRLKVLRAERDWTQADLAERLEVSRQSVNDAIETGKFDPSLPLAFRIARLFGEPVEAIFADDTQVSD